MKTPVAIVLIICGTLLLLAPSVFDQIARHQYLQALEAIPEHGAIPNYTLTSESFAGFIAYGSGGLMIAIATYVSLNSSHVKGFSKSGVKPSATQPAAST